MKDRLSKFQNYIWDWNGTLIDDIDLCLNIANDVMRMHRETVVSVEEYRAQFGFPVIDYWKRLGVDFEKESFEQLTDKFITAYNAKVLENDLHEGARQVLESLKEQGKSLFVLTAAHQKDVLELLDRLELRDLFVDIKGLDNYRAESKVQNGIDLVKHHGLDVEESVMLGDTIHDYEVAREMGVYSILIPNGHQSEERLRAIPDERQMVIGDIRDLIKNV